MIVCPTENEVSCECFITEIDTMARIGALDFAL